MLGKVRSLPPMFLTSAGVIASERMDPLAEYPGSVDSKSAGQLAKAESWLSHTAGNFEAATGPEAVVSPLSLDAVTDQEALVYLRSRGHDCHRSVANLIQIWKAAEQARLDQYNAPSGKRLSVEAKPNNIESISTIRLPNFWETPPLGEYSVDAAMLRTVDWCEIAGFEPWWRRLVREREEDLLRGGIDRNTAAFWLFNMVRSDYAIQLMPAAVLNRCLETITRGGPNEPQPESSYGAEGLDYDIAHASAIVFAHYRLPSDHLSSEVIQQAVNTLSKHQGGNGAWRSSGGPEPSIESTAMALHALALAQPIGWGRIAAGVRDWLWSVQQEDGSWTEQGAPGPAYLTVLVLDAIALSNGEKDVSFHRTTPPQETSRPKDGLGLASRSGNARLESDSTAPSAADGIAQHRDATAPESDTTDAPGESPQLDISDERRASVNAYIDEVWQKKGMKITRTDIWKRAKYRNATEFERWQRNDPKTTNAARQAFSGILKNKPHLK